MPKPNPNQAAVDAAVEDAKATLLDEAAELAAIVEELDPQEPVSTDGIKSLKDGIEALSNAFGPKPPDAGKFTVSVTATTNNRASGGENMRKLIKDENCDAAQRDALKRLFTEGLAAAQAVASEPKQGGAADTRVSFDDGEAPESKVLTSLLQVAAFDNMVALLAADVAQKQLDSIRQATS